VAPSGAAASDAADATVAGRGWVSLAPMVSDPELYELAVRVGQKLHAAERRLVTAESCTGGWVAKALTDVPGSSQWFECGYVTYSDVAKARDLRVAARTLESFGAVSEQTVREMAEGRCAFTAPPWRWRSAALPALMAARPANRSAPCGSAPLPVRAGDGHHRRRQTLQRDRDFVRSRSVQHALRLILRLDLPVRLQATPRPDAV